MSAGDLRGRAVRWDIVWLVVVGMCSSLWIFSLSREMGVTFDEPTYVTEGLTRWRTGSTRGLMRLGTMPLPMDVQMLPLRAMELVRGRLIDPRVELAEVLPIARAGNLIFWWLLLIGAMVAARDIAGSWGGRLAVSLLALEPTFLAHAALATTDIAAAAGLLIFALGYARTRASARRWVRIGMPGMLFGVALLTKASALPFVAITMLVVALVNFRAGRSWGPEPTRDAVDVGWWGSGGAWCYWKRFWFEGWAIGAIGLLIAFLYCGTEWAVEKTFVEWARSLPPGWSAQAWLWFSEALRIFPNAGEGIVKQITHNIRGHDAFILGTEYRRAVWWYFPVALSIKLTVPLLAGSVVVAVAHRKALWNWALLAAAALLLFSLTARVQIGVRMMLPVIALAIVGLAAAWVSAWMATSASPSRPSRPAMARKAFLALWVGVAVLSNALSHVRVWPHTLTYTNALWGGTSTGYLRLSDSNYDWGQGIPGLAAVERFPQPLLLWYFGGDPAAENASRFERIHPHDEAWLQGRSLREITTGRRVAVSLTLLYGAYLQKSPTGQHAAAYFRNAEPIARTSTFLIYEF